MKSSLPVLAVAMFTSFGDAHTPSSLVRVSDEEAGVLYTLLDGTTEFFSWTINVVSQYDTDTGFEWIQIEHNVKADIMPTDEVQFELAFRSASDPFINN